MATIAELMVKIGSDISGLQKGMAKAQHTIQNAGRAMQRVGQSLTLSVTAPLAGVGGMALKTAADFESLQQSMNILNGSVEEGQRNFERLQEFSATTPFQLNELAEAQNMLQGFGLSADQAFESMSMIGDIAAVASGDIKGIGIAFGQAAAEGRLMTRDIRQLINQGVPAIKLLSDTMGVAESDILDLASEGEISFEILQQSFREATSEGGMFANGMSKQAETLAGRFSTMKDNINLALGSVGDVMSDLAKGVMNQVIEIAQAFRSLDDATKQMITTAGILAAAIPPLIFLGGKLAVIIGGLISPIGAAVAAIGALIVIGKNLYDNWEVIEADLTHLWEGIELVAWEIVGGIMNAFDSMASGILNTLSSMASAIQPSLVVPLEVAKSRIQAANESIQQHVRNSRKEFEDAGKAAALARTDMTSLSESFWSITDAIQGGLTDGLSWLSDQLFDVKTNAQEAKKALESISNVTVQSPTTEAAKQSKRDLSSMKAETTGFTSAVEAAGDITVTFADRFVNAFKRAGDSAKLTGEAVTTAFQAMSDKSISSLKSLAAVTVNTARKIIAAELAKAVAAAVRGALTSVPFPLNIALAAGAGAAAAGIFNAVVPELAQGGLAFGPTLAVVGDNQGAASNPEVIAPLDKLKGMMGGGGSRELYARIKGSDIFLSSERGKNKFR